MMPALDLSAAPPVLFFYGLAGAGKTHVGRWVSECSGRFFYDADEDISDDMRQALAEQRPFTEAMRAEFFPRIVARIDRLRQQHGPLVVTQGAYKQRHRDYLQQQVAGLQPVCVTCSDAVLQQRLAARANGISPASAAALRADFETPRPGSPVLVNDGDAAALLQQLQALYPVSPTRGVAP